MSELCPYAHQLCQDLARCEHTPEEVQQRYQAMCMENFRTEREIDQKAGLSDEVLKARRLSRVAEAFADCPQAIPWPTRRALEKAATANPFGAPL